jgi:hypothetical protein
MQSNYDSENILIVRIGCEKHDVAAETLIALMQATVSLIQAANRTVCPKDVLQVNVSSFVPGSFEIFYKLVIPSVPILLEKAPIIASTLAICKDYLSVRKWFHGKPQPNTIEPGMTIHDNTEYKAEIINIYNNSQVTQNFSQAFTDVQKDDSIKEIDFYKGGNKKELLVKIPITNFVDFIRPNIVETAISPEKKESVARTSVTIHTPVLAKTAAGKKHSKWKVIYNSRIISVDIQDENFRQNVDSTIYRFGVGDKLEVEIIEKKIFNVEMNEFIVNNAGYVITKVWDHIPGKKQAPSKHSSQNTQKTLFDANKKPRKK